MDGESGGGIVFPTDGFRHSVVLVLYNRGEKLLKGRGEREVDLHAEVVAAK